MVLQVIIANHFAISGQCEFFSAQRITRHTLFDILSSADLYFVVVYRTSWSAVTEN